VLIMWKAAAWAGADIPAAARTPVVGERLVGTWRPVDHGEPNPTPAAEGVAVYRRR
jgi:hypothetical protein